MTKPTRSLSLDKGVALTAAVSFSIFAITFSLPSAAPGAGTPPILVPGQPMYAPVPVPRSGM